MGFVMHDRDHGPVRLSWVLATEQPEGLARFYAEVLEATARRGLSDSHWLVDVGEGEPLQFYCPSRARTPDPKGRSWAPCLTRMTPDQPLNVVRAWSALASEHGAEQKEDPRLEPFGAECWMQDPEGHAFLLLVTSSSC